MKKVTRVKIVLQGSTESFQDYENRLNSILEAMEDGPGRGPIAMPSADSSGRMCCVVHFEEFIESKSKKS